ncbi:hypothetical protein Ga0080574_TMP2607 [Salipiger abyssi]|uniref:Uncharacterized protein n=1 Tax=Salipiger abyssi TaxID=1250539 RepID=A0A1P8UU70_9RHOB|nr:hypothetical protein Ga0080574_TMP2607 [Salipiger abyssi]
MGGLDCVHAPAEQGDIAFVRILGSFSSAHGIQRRIGPARKNLSCRCFNFLRH